MTIDQAIEILEAECGCVELDMSFGDVSQAAKNFSIACHMAVDALRLQAAQDAEKVDEDPAKYII